MNHPPPLTTRLTLLFILVSSVVLISLSWVLHAAVECHFMEMDRSILESKMDVRERVLERPPTTKELPALQEYVDRIFRSDLELMFFVETTAGNVLLPSPETAFPVETIRALGERATPSVFACGRVREHARVGLCN